MKKTVLLLVLAAALVLSFASAAMARPNGNIYIKWSAAAPNDTTPTPHAGYATATEKCNVCHAVHYAATAGAVWNDTSGTPSGDNAWTADAASANTQMLLRSSVANACNYCHITTTIGGVRLYGGTTAAYTTSSSFAHNSKSAQCTGCHAVHGANTFQGANTNKILRVRADRPIQADVLASNPASRNADITPLFADQSAAVNSNNKYTQQVAFCTQCHAEYTSGSENTITATGGLYDGGGYTNVPYKGHPMKAADSNFETSTSGATYNGQVAFMGSGTCRDCHDAGLTDQSGTTWNSYPHYTQGYFRFMTTGASVAATDAANNGQTVALDGNCLKCHVNSAKDAGVGITF